MGKLQISLAAVVPVALPAISRWYIRYRAAVALPEECSRRAPMIGMVRDRIVKELVFCSAFFQPGAREAVRVVEPG